MLRKLLLSPLLFMSIVSLAQNTTPQWNRKADLPTPRAGCRAVALEGKLYVVGGATGFEDAVSTFEVYDPNTDRWSKLADLPSPVAFGGAATFGGKIYVKHPALIETSKWPRAETSSTLSADSNPQSRPNMGNRIWPRLTPSIR